MVTIGGCGGTFLAMLSLPALSRGDPLRLPSLLGSVGGGALYLGFIVAHEATHAAVPRAFGPRILRFGLGGGGAHVRYVGLEYRPGARLVVAIAAPGMHVVAAVGLVLLVAGGDWTRTAHPVVLAPATLNVLEGSRDLDGVARQSSISATPRTAATSG
jgi:hypothetical protein